MEGEGSGYIYLKFSKNDELLASVRKSPTITTIHNLNTKSIEFEPGKNYFNVEILPDNIHYFLYYATWSRTIYSELRTKNNLLKTYNFSSGISDVFEDNGKWNIFCCSRNTPIRLLTNEPVGVETDTIINERIIISDSDNNLFIQIYNIFANNLLLEISDLQGSIIYSSILQNNSPNNRILFPVNLNSGVYICKITAGDKSCTHKFQIVR